MKEERAIELLEYLKGSEVGNVETGIALDMAISSLCRQEQLIRALLEMSVKYAEMYLDTEPDTEDHILDRVRYRAAADIYANAANMARVLLKGE